jgi:hypothetical protein
VILQRSELGNLDILPILVKAGALISELKPVATFLNSAKAYIASIFTAQHIAQMFGARSPRYTQDELLKNIYNIHAKYLGRTIYDADLQYWYPKIMYGYLSFDDMVNAIKQSDEYKQRKAIAWELIRQAWVEILGHEPSETLATAENNYYYMLLISGQQPIEAIRQALRDSAEYKSKHPIPDWLIPAIVGAGAIFLL